MHGGVAHKEHTDHDSLGCSLLRSGSHDGFRARSSCAQAGLQDCLRPVSGSPRLTRATSPSSVRSANLKIGMGTIRRVSKGFSARAMQPLVRPSSHHPLLPSRRLSHKLFCAVVGSELGPPERSYSMVPWILLLLQSRPCESLARREGQQAPQGPVCASGPL